MTDREAMQQALEAWDSTVLPVANDGMMQERMEILRETLEQPEQEPVALETVYETIIHWDDEGGGKRSRRELARRIVNLYTTPPTAQPAPVQEPVAWVLTAELDKRETTTRAHLWFSDPVNCMWTPIYTTPPAAQRNPLTWEQISQIGLECANDRSRLPFEVKLARAIEAAHDIKEEP